MEFIKIENETISTIQCDNTVIATGGSAVFGTQAMHRLKQNGIVVFIDVPINILKSRISSLASRGVVTNGLNSLEDILADRLPLYNKYADIKITLYNMEICRKYNKAKNRRIF